MIPQIEAFESVIAYLKDMTGINILTSAQLPADGCGTTAELEGGTPKGRYLNKQHGKEMLTVLFLCKNINQKTAVENICAIGNSIDTVPQIRGRTVNVMFTEKRGGAEYVGYDGKYYVYSLLAEIAVCF